MKSNLKNKKVQSDDFEIIKLLEKDLGIKLKVFHSYTEWINSFEGCYLKGENVLGLNINGITDNLPDSISQLKSLEELNLHANALTSIMPLSKLINLSILSLSENQITDISPLKGLINLKVLNINGNEISDISSLKKLNNLEVLDLSHNKIQDIGSLANLKKLKELNLVDNELIDISPLKGLEDLNSLKLWGNSITDIAPLSELYNLNKLDLYRNNITDISPIAKLNNLTVLDLGYNGLKDIEPLNNLTKLKILDLWQCPMIQISSLKLFDSLTELNLSYCELEDISVLENFKNLVKLDLTGNSLTFFPKWLLETEMENNSEMSAYDFLEQGFSIAENPIENVPHELLTESKAVINDYFKSLENGSQAINEIKVILLGEGAAGKTSLMKYLQGKPFNKQESQTHGINLEECVGETGVTMKVWDFGGQDIMHHTHQFFLTQKSVYVLVLNARENTDTEKWLKLIQVFGGDSPIIIVTNKIDENPSAHENMKFLNAKYKNLDNRYLRISIEKGIGLDEFKKILTVTIKKLLHVRTLWGNSWLGVKKELEEMRNGESLKDYIHFEKYNEICEKHGVVKAHRDTLIKWLHRLGVVTYFPDTNLNETNVINPSWLTEAFYAVINSKEVASNFGRFSLSQLQSILDIDKYPRQKYGYLIGLMSKFELCYKIGGENYLIPDLLNKEEPEFVFDVKKSLKFKYRYTNLLPKAVFPKFIARRHREIKDDIKWRTGLIIKDSYFESEALVRMDETEKEISVYVNGEEKRGYLASIISNFEDINKLYDGIAYDMLVPCCCEMCKDEEIPFYHQYEVLKNLKNRGRTTKLCDNSIEDVSIDLLLGVLITHERLEEEIKNLVGRGTFKTKKYLEEGKVTDFIDTVKAIFSSVSYLLFEKSEKAYHTPLFILLRSIFSSDARADEIQAKGRTDIIINTVNYIYILELKLDNNADSAFEQIHEKKYYEPFLLDEKKIILIGINFSSQDRNIVDYKFEKFK